MSKMYFIMATVGLCVLMSIPVQATTKRETTYGYGQIWNTAIRFLRVDNDFKVTENDKETGYVLFDYVNAGRTLTAAMEIIPLVRDGKWYITIGLRIQDMPSYIEGMLMDQLERKLRTEYGEPPAPRMVSAVPAEVKETSTRKTSSNGKSSKKDSASNEPSEESEEASRK